MSELTATLQIQADLNELIQVRQFVKETAVVHINDQQIIDDLILAVDEAVANIIRYGYQHQSGNIEISIRYQPNEFEITLCDWSPNFDPTQVTPPNPDAPLSQRKSGGMGIYIMRHLTDELQYQQLPDGRNELKLIKQI